MIQPITSTTQLVFNCDINEFEPHVLLAAIKAQHSHTIKEWLRHHCDIDPDTFEGGFDNWWGMGSVTVYELGLQFTFHYTQEMVVVTIK